MPNKNLTAAFVEKVKSNGKRTDYFDDSLPGFSLRVSEKGVKSWCVSYRFGGKWTRYTFGTFPILSLKDARKKAKDALHDVSEGVSPATRKKVERDAETFEYLAREYMERWAKKRKRSWKEDQRIIDADLGPTFGTMKAREITRGEVKAFLRKKAETAPIAANRTWALLRKIYNWGIDEEIVEFNPAHHIKRPASEHSRDRVLTEDEIKRVWKAIDTDRADTDDSHRREKALSAAIMKLRLITAQRGAEVMAMEWSELDGDWWTIPGTKTKNGLAHRVPLASPAMKILTEIKSTYYDGSRYVFQSPKRPNQHISNPQKALARIQKTTGIDFVGHDFRRTVASHVTSSGIPRLIVKMILNHVEPGVTKVYDRYSYDKEKRDGLEAWSKRLMLMVSDLKEVKSEVSEGHRSDEKPRDQLICG